MKYKLEKPAGLILFSVIVFSVSFGIMFLPSQLIEQNAFGSEEQFLILQNGIISTVTDDYMISNDFEIRILQEGKLMRISGITTSGNPYYAYQKIVGDEVIVNGKIIIDGRFVPIVQREIIKEEPEAEQIQPIKMVISQSHSTYWRQDYFINVKVFEAEKNPLNDYWFKEFLVPNIPISVDVNHVSGRHLATIQGITDENGYFRGKHFVQENLDWQGEYNVHVVAGNEIVNDTQDLTMFIIGEVIGANYTRG